MGRRTLNKLSMIAASTLLAVSSVCVQSTAYADEIQLPKLGEAAGSTLSVAQEQQIGDDIMRQIRRSEYLMKDPIVTDYIQHLGYRLVAANPDALGRQFQFFVIQENSINAFALPGGYVGIHSGLITASQSESELASVLGHEVAHVTQRHLARRLERQNELSIPSILGLIASVLVATQDPEAGMAGVAATQAAGQQSIINHTRENEKEADRIGITMLSAAGFDVSAAADFFETLQQASRYTFKPPEILLTHPLSRNRIAAARERAELYPKVDYQDSIDYFLVKSRVRSKNLINDKEAFRGLESRYSKKQLNSLEELYLYAELLKMRGNNSLAIKVLSDLYQKHSSNQLLLFSLAEAHLAHGSGQEMLPLLESQLSKTPDSTKLLLATSEIYIRSGQPTKAESLLLRYADVHQKNPNYLKLLAKAQADAGNTPEMYETTGQYLMLLGDLRSAKKHFERALNATSKDPYAQTRIQARLDDVRQQMRAVLKAKSER
ncbi:M48 family metalloprotease [Kangiella spongicola]|jgi:predicted Zn-dependent protease|uniref:Putative beta-barrel assembly-enhancing protease n=1 Tax=Kangiella spongicola TaxID=796379 RepID=A0A318D150_9GAMM|nr:M48 family metalloprotease [Kangiella spongicola]PXF62952.1 peptidase M48 Ste24p [Kangiella spongicola]